MIRKGTRVIVNSHINMRELHGTVVKINKGRRWPYHVKDDDHYFSTPYSLDELRREDGR